MHDDVSAQLQRLLQGWCTETVVDHQLRALGVSNLGQCGDIHQLGQRVGRRLDEQQLGVGLDCRVPASEIHQRYVVDLHTETLEVLFEQADGRTEYALGDQHVVTRAAQGHHRGEDRRHAGGSSHRLLGAFQGGNALFERAYGRVGVA
ncbi:hypothetical protein D3C80_1594180 [compost metagenome]